ncbi:MAG: serine hydrolase [Thermoanaerobaculia bacterium]
MRKVQFAVLAFALLLVTPAASAQRLDERKIDKVIMSMMAAWQVPGAAVAVVKDDRVMLVKGYGTTQLGGTDPVTADTLFQIASVSKAFTTTAIAMLAEEKKLTWDDPVSKHLEYFRLADPCATSMVTLRDLASHRTGAGRFDELWDNTPITREELVRRLAHLPQARSFRSGYGYQNIMFVAAGEVVGRASGMSWDEFVRTRIFKPLGMTGSALTDEEWAKAHHATGYRWDSETQRLSVQQPISTTTIGAAGAVKSNARDMANWLRFHLTDGYFDGRQVISAEALAETKKPHVPLPVEKRSRDLNPATYLMAYALGWNVQDHRGEMLVSHGGALNGFRTHIDLLPERNIGFVVMINSSRTLATIAARNSLIDLLTSKPGRDWNAYYQMVEQQGTNEEATKRKEREAARAHGTSPSHPLTAFNGDYESPSHGPLRISGTETLLLEWNQLRIPMTHWHYDTFNALSETDDVDELVTFEKSDKGEVNMLTFFGQKFERKK